MRAVGVHRMDFVIKLDQQDLAALDTLHLCFDFIAILEIQGGEVFKFKLSHVVRHCRKVQSIC